MSAVDTLEVGRSRFRGASSNIPMAVGGAAVDGEVMSPSNVHQMVQPHEEMVRPRTLRMLRGDAQVVQPYEEVRSPSTPRSDVQMARPQEEGQVMNDARGIQYLDALMAQPHEQAVAPNNAPGALQRQGAMAQWQASAHLQEETQNENVMGLPQSEEAVSQGAATSQMAVESENVREGGGIRSRCTQVFQGRGFFARQAIEVMMDDRVAQEMVNMAQNNRQEVQHNQWTIEQVGLELLRRSEILSQAIHQVSTGTLGNNLRVIADLQRLADELSGWAAQMSDYTNKSFLELDQKLHRSQNAQGELLSASVRDLDSKIDALRNQCAQAENAREWQYKELQKRIEASVVEMQQTFKTQVLQEVDGYLRTFEKPLEKSVRQKVEERLQSFKKAIMNTVQDNANEERPNEEPKVQEVHDLSAQVISQNEKINSIEQDLGSITEKLGEINFVLEERCVNFEDLKGVKVEVQEEVHQLAVVLDEKVDAVEQDIAQVRGRVESVTSSLKRLRSTSSVYEADGEDQNESLRRQNKERRQRSVNSDRPVQYEYPLQSSTACLSPWGQGGEVEQEQCPKSQPLESRVNSRLDSWTLQRGPAGSVPVTQMSSVPPKPPKSTDMHARPHPPDELAQAVPCQYRGHAEEGDEGLSESSGSSQELTPRTPLSCAWSTEVSGRSRTLQKEPRRSTTPRGNSKVPHFGTTAMTGKVTPEDMKTFIQMERKLVELPKLNIPSGEAWERNMILNTWVKEVVLAATSVSLPFSDFVANMIDVVRTRYTWQRGHPNKELIPLGQPPEDFRYFNSKLCVLLLPAIPELVKIRVLEDTEEGTQLTAPGILSEVWDYVSPGGQEELEGLTKYIRKPGSAATAEEARKTIRTWMLARKRAVVMSIPDLSPYEQVKVLESLVKGCLLYTSPSPRDGLLSRMPSSA